MRPLMFIFIYILNTSSFYFSVILERPFIDNIVCTIRIHHFKIKHHHHYHTIIFFFIIINYKPHLILFCTMIFSFEINYNIMFNDIKKKYIYTYDEKRRVETYRHHLQDIKAHFSNYTVVPFHER